MSTPSLGAMSMMSPHRAVLEADPETDESKQKLVEELQSRGRAAVGSKNWMDAKLLYEKVLTISTVDDKKKAIIHSNLSLVEKNMGKLEEAFVAAESATKEDPTYVKGYWRLGQALVAMRRLSEALEAFSKAKELDPTNKALVKELDKVQKQIDEEEPVPMDVDDKDDDATKKKKNSTTKTTTVLPKASKSTSSSSNNTSNKKKENVGKENHDGSLRGYKIVNGKKTSYFHNELDENTKALIGDIAPKKIETTNGGTTNNNAVKTTTPKNTSEWNKAGTWEEKDVSGWAKETLTKSLKESTYVLPSSSPAPGAKVTVEKVTTLDGHASVAVVRGKTRFIYEFCCKLDWKLEQDDDELECTGSLAIPDIDGTVALGEGYEIHDFRIDSVSNNSVKPVVDRFVHRGGFSESLTENIDNWVRLFRNKYGPAAN